MLAGLLAMAVSAGAIYAVVPALAQQPGTAAPSPKNGAPKNGAEDRVELIMEGLPAPGTPGYKALIAHAGRDAKGQVLSLTRTEMWNVRRTNVEAVKKAAAAKNVSVRVLDEGWNRVFTPMPTTSMDAKATSMMGMAKQSKATVGMGVMAPATPAVVEYALTKDMHAKGPQGQPMTIRIALNESTTVTAVRQNVEIKGDRCTWRGVVEGTENPVTIMWWASGRITGTINMGDRIYQLKQMSDGVIGIVESMAEKLPDEHARVNPQRMIDMKMKEDTFYMQGDSSAARPKRDETKDQQDDVTKGVRTARVDPKHLQTAKAPGRTASKAKDGVVIDVMIVYTAKAAAHYTDIRRDLIDIAIDDTNESFKKSRVDGVSVRLVHTHLTDYDEAGAEHFDHVWRMVDRDRHMEEVPKLRDEKKADIVVLVVDDASGCGLATRVAAGADEAYAVVHHECAATSYSIAHEIGHILGARHDRSLDKGGTPYAFGHGFVSPDLKWRTMMSYKAGCNGCPRLPIWSTPQRVVKGQPAGDKDNDNARVIRERAALVAQFR